MLDNDISIDEYEYKNNRSKIYSQSRTLKTVYDISRCNDWEYFITLTFNPNKVNSFDYDECTSKVSRWIDTIRRNNKDLKYIGVPEKHKSGRYHFHFLFSNCDNLKLVDSGLFTKSGLIIYNIDNYNWGYSTATEVTNTDAVNKYIAKYLTKDLFGSTKGKKRYWASRNCNRPKEIKEYNSNVSETINELDNSSNLLHKQIKTHEFLSEETGEIIQRDIIYYEFDKE